MDPLPSHIDLWWRFWNGHWYVWHETFECWQQVVMVFRQWNGEIVSVWCTLGSAPPRYAPPRGGSGDTLGMFDSSVDVTTRSSGDDASIVISSLDDATSSRRDDVNIDASSLHAMSTCASVHQRMLYDV